MAERSNGERSLPPPSGPQRHPLPPTSPDRDDRESQSPRGTSSSSYPQPSQSSEWDDRRPAPPSFPLPRMQPNVTLPPIHGIYAQSFGPPSGPGNPPPADPRMGPGSSYAASPTSANGHHHQQPHIVPYPQYHVPPPGGHHGGSPVPNGAHPGPFADYYALGHQHRPPPGYPAPPPGYVPYQGYAPAGPYGEYIQGHPQQQIAPRQRTSIACRYCRKRKIRCSGYQNTTNGKCTNCDKLKIDCIFQPVSSGVSQAFIPVSAIPGGVPPGTQLFGAYGQPLPPSAQAQNGYPPPQGYQQHPHQHQHQHPHQHQQALPSPTSQYAPHADGPSRGRRRPRESDDEDRHPRLPPPPAPDSYQQGYDARRRSPVSADSNTPPMYHYQHSTRSFEADRTPTPRRNSLSPTTSTMSGGVHSPATANFPPPTPGSHGLAPPNSGGQGASSSSRSSGAPASNGGRSPSTNGLPPPVTKSPTAGAEGAGSSSIMSLGHLVQGPSQPFRGSDIDDSMLGKLNRRS